jgi:aerobic carbon-monoxide dehydrogenase medium subunit
MSRIPPSATGGPSAAALLGASIVVRGPGGERRIAAEDFFTGIYETRLTPQDLLVAIELPVARNGSAHFFQEFARRHGDYAIAGLAAQAVLQGDRFADLRLSYFAVGDKPVLAKAAGKLAGVTVGPALLAEASEALSHELDPHEDQQASAAMRRHLARVLLARCVASLLNRPDLQMGGVA